MSYRVMSKEKQREMRLHNAPPQVRTGAPSAVDRALRKNTDAASYDLDAEAIAKVLVRYYGDEAEAVLARAVHFLGDARRAKR